MIELFMLVVAGLAIVAAVMVVATFAKLVLWLVLLPLRLLLYVLLLPLLLLKLVLGGVALAVVLPLVAIALIVAGIGLAVPLLPLLAVGVLIWLLVRGARTAAIAR